jgi:hypothetical protein
VEVEVGAVLGFAVEQEVIAVEDWVIARAQDLAVANGDQGVPQAATMSKPSWVRPPLRGAPNSPI